MDRQKADAIRGEILKLNTWEHGSSQAETRAARAGAAAAQTESLSASSEEFQSTDTADTAVYWTLWGLDKTGTAAGFVAGGPGVVNLVKTVGVRAATKQIAKEGAKQLVVAAAYEGTSYVAGEVSVAAGADRAAVEDARRYVDAGVGIFNLSRTFRTLGRLGTWGKPSSLPDHLKRHGADFGLDPANPANMDRYAAMARGFFKGRAGYLQKVDKSGKIRVYDPATNTFGAFNADGTTATFYKPDPATHGFKTNWDYWNALPGKSP